MRKPFLALTALACLITPASAQQAPAFSIYGPIPPGSNAIGSVLADLRVAGSPVAAGNPVPVTGTLTLGAGSATIGSVNVLGGNATAVKTDGSGVTQPVSAASLPLPAGAATAANQSSVVTALGGTGDAAYAGSGAASTIAALKGVYNATLAPLASGTNLIGKVGLDQTTPGTTNGVVVNSSALPAGAATAANQATEISALQALNSRASYGNDFAGSLAAGGSLVGQSYTTGSVLAGNPARGQSAFTKFSVFFFSTQAGTAYIDGSNDGTTWTQLDSVALVASAGAVRTVPVIWPYHRGRVVNGSTAASGTIVQSSLLAN